MSMVSIGTLAGPPLAGWLSQAHGHVAPFLLAAAVLVVDGVLRIVFVKPTAAQQDDPATALDVLRAPGSWPVVVLIALGAVVTAAIEPILPMQLATRHGMGATGIGLLFGLLVIVGAIVNPVAGSLLGRVSPRLLACVGTAIAAIGFLLIGLSPTIGGTVCGVIGLGASIAFLVAPASTLIGVQGMKTTPPALGGAYSLYNLAYAAGLMCGPALSGVATQVGGYGAACILFAVIVAGTSVATVPRLPGRLASLRGRDTSA